MAKKYVETCSNTKPRGKGILQLIYPNRSNRNIILMKKINWGNTATDRPRMTCISRQNLKWSSSNPEMHRESIRRAVRIVISDLFVPRTSDIIFFQPLVSLTGMQRALEVPGSNPPPYCYLDLFLVHVVTSSTPPPRCVNSQLVSLPPAGFLTVYVIFGVFSYLFTVSPISTTVLNTFDT